MVSIAWSVQRQWSGRDHGKFSDFESLLTSWEKWRFASGDGAPVVGRGVLASDGFVGVDISLKCEDAFNKYTESVVGVSIGISAGYR